jgi:hypothetical protein
MSRQNNTRDTYERGGPQQQPNIDSRTDDAGYSDSREGERSERRTHGEEAFRHYPSGSSEHSQAQSGTKSRAGRAPSKGPGLSSTMVGRKMRAAK